MTPDIELIENFTPAVDVESLWGAVDWDMDPTRQLVPRYESWVNENGEAYTYGREPHERTYEARKFTGYCADLKMAIDAMLDMQPNCCFINGYMNQSQNLGWHADDSPEMSHDHPIIIVSVGAEREIWFRPKPHPALNRSETAKNPDVALKVLMPSMSALIMPAGFQQKWQHRIPKHDRMCGKRISYTFRTLI